MKTRKRSMIFSALDRGARAVYEAVGQSTFGRMLSGDGLEKNLMENSTVGKFWADRTRLVRMRQRVSAAMEKSALLNAASDVWKFLFSTALYVYGIFLLLQACFVYAFYFLFRALSVPMVGGEENLVFGGILLIISLPLLFSRISVWQAMEKSVILSHLLHGLLGFPERNLPGNEEREGEKNGKNLRGWMFVLLALAAVGCGAASCRFGTLTVQGVLIGGALFFLLLNNPEAAILLAAFLLPFCLLFSGVSGKAPLLLFLPVTIGNFSYLIKALCGKRQMDFSPFDMGVALFALFAVAGGIFAAGGAEAFGEGLVSAMLILFYFPASNLMRYEKWRMRCVHVLTASGGLTSFLLCAGILIPRIFPSTVGFAPATPLWKAASAMAAHAEWMIAFYGMLFPLLCLAGMKQKRILSGFSLLCATCVAAFALLSLEEGTTWIYVFAAALLFFFLQSRRTPAVLLLAAPPAVALTALLFPGSQFAEYILNSRLFSDASAETNRMIRAGAARLFFAHPVGGIGVGISSFTEKYPTYAPDGYAGAENAHSLYLGIGVAEGVVGLILFSLLLLLLLRFTFHFTRSCRLPTVRTAVLLLFSGVAGMLFAGLTVDIWSNASLLVMSWLLIGLLRGMTAREQEKAELRRNEKSATAREADFVIDGATR